MRFTWNWCELDLNVTMTMCHLEITVAECMTRDTDNPSQLQCCIIKSSSSWTMSTLFSWITVCWSNLDHQSHLHGCWAKQCSWKTRNDHKIYFEVPLKITIYLYTCKSKKAGEQVFQQDFYFLRVVETFLSIFLSRAKRETKIWQKSRDYSRNS